MINVVLLGSPGSGKDTLANKLVLAYNYMALNTGELYRKEAELKTAFGLKAKEYWLSGNLCPDEMTNELMGQAIKTLPQTTGLIFNGYPRSVQQARHLNELATVGIALDLLVEDETAISRLLLRKREDDTEEAIKQRLRIYYANNSDLVAYYRETGRYRTINANLTPEEVFSTAVSVILEETR